MMPQILSLKVADARTLNPLIRQLRLVAADGAVLPGYTAGAHVRVKVTLADGVADWRHYSLINFSTAPGATEAPRDYVIAVRREDGGRGGSRFMHERVSAGDTLTIEAPKNEFPLRELDNRAVMIEALTLRNPCMAAIDPVCKGAGQRALADARLAGYENELALAGQRQSEPALQFRQFSGSADQSGRVRRSR